MSDDWEYTQRFWSPPTEAVPHDLAPAFYADVFWTRRPTLNRSRGERRKGEETFLQDWAEEHKRVYLARPQHSSSKEQQQEHVLLLLLRAH